MTQIDTSYKYNGLPLYEATIEGAGDGVFCVSFVSQPATETTWQLFSARKKRFVFNSAKMEVTGVLMLADTPIYRVDEETGAEYYLYYSAATLQQMVSKLLKDNSFNTIDTQHDGHVLSPGTAEMTEIYVKTADKCPNEFRGIPDGSVICSYKINDQGLWGMMRDGALTGFSLAGYFTIREPETNINFYNINTKMNKKSKKNSIKALLSRLVLRFEETTLTDGTVWLHDGELTEGTAVTLEDGTPVPDGSYETDTLTITVTDGVVSSVSQKDAPAEEVEAEDDTAGADDRVAKLEEEVASLRADIDAIKSILASETDTPVVEEFKRTVKKDGKMNKTARFIAAL